MTPQDDTDGAWFNYTDYEHNALRLFRVGVTADVRLTDRVSVLTEIRSENGDSIKPYALYVRVRPWRDRPIDIQAGRIPPTFGAFARRDYGAGNPLIGYPLAYQYLTAVRPDALPASTEDVLRMRARGWRPSYPIGSLAIAPGMPLITAFRWDTGVQVRVGPESLNVSAAVTNGTAVRSAHARQQRRQTDRRPAPVAADRRAGARRLGGARCVCRRRGAGDRDDAGRNGTLDAAGARCRRGILARSLDAARRADLEPVAGADALANARRHERVRRRALQDFAGPVRREPHRSPQLQRAGVVVRTARTWDAPVTRLETGVGYYIRRNLLAKGAYQHNWRDGGLVTSRGLFAAQLHFWL